MIVKKVIIGMLAAVLLTTSSPAMVEFGVLALDFSGVSEDQFKINIHYADCNGYSVMYVADDEYLYRGEVPQSFDDYLPSNRIRITLGDCKMSERVKKKYSAWKVYDINHRGQNICFMWCHNDDHGVYLYLASDYLLCVDERSFTKLEKPIGKISINIKVGKNDEE